MPRYPRNYFKTSFFHVMTQGINKLFIFDTPEDIKFYIKNMYELSKEYKIEIIAYCIMNNHTHMLVKVEKIEELSSFMLRLNTKYARFYNKKYNRVGYVFRNRYKSEGIYDKKHLHNCVKYIYDNPVKAGICNHPKEYKWSNYKPTKTQKDENYIFIDEEETINKIYKEVIDKYLNAKQIQMQDLNNSKMELKELTTILNKDYKLPIRRIARELNVTREKLRKIYKE